MVAQPEPSASDPAVVGPATIGQDFAVRTGGTPDNLDAIKAYIEQLRDDAVRPEGRAA